LRTIVLCLDVSESMGYGEPTKLSLATAAALKATEGLSSDDLVGLVSFDAEAEVVLDLQPANLERVQSEFDQLATRGVSCIAAGLKEAARLLEKNHLNGAILLLTDGRANLSLSHGGGFEGSLDLERELLRISDEAHYKNIVLHAVSVGEDAFTQTLSMMAESTRGFHWIADIFQGLDCPPRELHLKIEAQGLRVHAAPAELPSAQPTWTKESQFLHVSVVSQNLYEEYESNRMAFLTNPQNDRKARTALVSIDDGSLVAYRERRPKTVEEIRKSAILLDRSYRDYLNLSQDGSVNILIY